MLALNVRLIACSQYKHVDEYAIPIQSEIMYAVHEDRIGRLLNTMLLIHRLLRATAVAIDRITVPARQVAENKVKSEQIGGKIVA